MLTIYRNIPAIALILCAILGMGRGVPSYFSLYDFARTNSTLLADDIVGSGPTMTGGNKTTNGVYLESATKWNSTSTGSNILYVTPAAGLSSATVIAAFNVQSCDKGYFYQWAVVTSSSAYPRCGLGCAGSGSEALTWKIYCVDAQSRSESSANFTTPVNVSTSIGMEYFADGTRMGMKLYALYEGGELLVYTFTSSLITYDDFFPKAQLAYRPSKGNLYYVGFLSETITSSQFLAYSSNATANITCANCVGTVAADLDCGTEPLNAVPNVTRRYFCSCGQGYGYDLYLGKCVETTVTDCSIACSAGCRKDDTAQCKTNCPSSMIVSAYNGDFVTCQCETGKTMGSDGTCEYTATTVSTDGGLYSWRILVIIVVLVGVVVAILSYVIVCCVCSSGNSRRVASANEANNPPNNEPADPQHEPSPFELFKIESIRLSAECKICYRSDVRLVAIIPCGHAGVCENCVRRIGVCPFDRSRIADWMVVDQELKERLAKLHGEKPAGQENVVIMVQPKEEKPGESAEVGGKDSERKGGEKDANS